MPLPINPITPLLSRFRRLSRGEKTNWGVLFALMALLLFVLVALWLYVYLKSLERPYYELKGYRVADQRSLTAFLRREHNRTQLAQLADFLERAGVGDVTPAANLLRQGPDWLDIEEPPFALPPQDQWRNMVATLAMVRDRVQPAVGPVEIVSAYRSDSYNQKAGGANGRAHQTFCALDLVPQSNISRKELIEELRSLHARLGPESNFGLGVYSDVRFHVDTCGYRSW
ncbi:D-Ala-D-Ala carboxypeptidase family metallohydrolase [Microbulbifer rhizosphaerae]|uniref:Peptidase M15A C-terminal domain-containing protein n=1 Tax=Microbulbifer rhizosphaerae TaxID=1562603 RepID=A0A7W4WAA0_9GAMM|nr:D-Ala-D-Ala carboxypeptidase family metallohydrolase [Microbulbifer rhizosphaerae]MBB3060556.1 hypothetical protein [Microbulbifer rhizosphaerae]